MAMYTRAAGRGGLNSVYLCHKKDHLAAGRAGLGWWLQFSVALLCHKSEEDKC